MKLAVAVLLVAFSTASVAAQPASTYDHRSFLKTYCIECHGPNTQEGDLQLDTLSVDFADPLVSSKWGEVLNSVNGHEMPPEEKPQPSPESSARFAEWLESNLAKAEIAKRSSRIVLRRMNRSEYNHTIRDLVGIDFQPADSFPEDPPAGGFDNNGEALTMSPLQMELYYSAAQKILDRALVEGEKPAAILWHLEPEENTDGPDRYRVEHDGNRLLLNDGENPTQNGFTVIHHDAWNKGVGFRDFKLPCAGEYIIRIRAAGRTPIREQVVASARKMLEERRDEQVAKNPESKNRADASLAETIEHFATDRMYDYGPPRIKVGVDLGGTPNVVDEFDVDATEFEPKTYEVRAYFTTEKAGVKLNYAYSVPRVLENFWMQNHDSFARPELLVDWVELEGPVNRDWPPASHKRLLIQSPNKERDEIAYAKDVLRLFMSRAYRRRLLDDELEAKVRLFESVRKQKPSFVEAIKVPMTSVLTSPHFLYLTEPHLPDDEKPRPVAPLELASRLSYFLWSSMPDDELFRVAARGDLNKPEVMKAQLSRMLADPRSSAFVKNFAGQWLGLRKVGANPPTDTLYPKYDRHLEVSMVRETEAFFAEILHGDLDARNLIKSDFVTINERLARFYGIPNVKGDEMRRVVAPEHSHRGGLVTQASIHCITSNGTRTSPVTRGVWVMKTLLGKDPGLPVANVGEIPSDVPGIGKATVRQRLQIHRENPSCARCHNKMDPLGFAMENFNACGEWRDREGHGYNGRIERNDPLIDAAAKMPDGTEFVGIEGLQTQLLANEDLFLSSLTSQLMTYALGRELGFADRDTVRKHVDVMKQNQYTLRSLILSIIQSEDFQTK